MTDQKDKLHMPYGEINPDNLTTGGLGTGASRTDTGGLDAAGNELGAVHTGSDRGEDEAQREEEADAGAHMS